jgi:hypothetical protein
MDQQQQQAPAAFPLVSAAALAGRAGQTVRLIGRVLDAQPSGLVRLQQQTNGKHRPRALLISLPPFFLLFPRPFSASPALIFALNHEPPRPPPAARLSALSSPFFDPGLFLLGASLGGTPVSVHASPARVADGHTYRAGATVMVVGVVGQDGSVAESSVLDMGDDFGNGEHLPFCFFSFSPFLFLCFSF